MMEINNLFKNTLFDKSMSNLKRALDYESANQQVLSGNMANVDTPGYKAKTIDFNQVLQQAEGASSSTLARTNEKHLKGSTGDGSVDGFSIETRENSVIDLDSEMGDMTKNNLLYEANTRLLTKKFLAIRAAIKGSY
jgi:flagellar basal-body rod protein FlgB